MSIKPFELALGALVFLFSILGIPQADMYQVINIGDMDFASGDNGYLGTGIEVNGTYFYTDNQDNSYVTNALGTKTGPHVINGKSAFGFSIGKTTAQNGLTIQQVGNIDIYTGDNGYSGRGQKIGNFYFYNDNR